MVGENGQYLGKKRKQLVKNTDTEKPLPTLDFQSCLHQLQTADRPSGKTPVLTLTSDAP